MFTNLAISFGGPTLYWSEYTLSPSMTWACTPGIAAPSEPCHGQSMRERLSAHPQKYRWFWQPNRWKWKVPCKNDPNMRDLTIEYVHTCQNTIRRIQFIYIYIFYIILYYIILYYIILYYIIYIVLIYELYTLFILKHSVYGHPPISSRQTSPDDPDGFAWAAADGPAEAGGEYEDRGGDRVRRGHRKRWPLRRVPLNQSILR